jgi:hypothetical protein
MRRLHFRLLLMTGLCITIGSCRQTARVPIVTARGMTGEEDTGSVAIPAVTLKAGETLLVSSSDEANDAVVTWNGAAMHEDIVGHGSCGCYTKIFSLYSASGGTGDIVASHISGGDLSMNAYSVTNLAPSALDKTKAGQGSDTNPTSGATPITTNANELLWGVIGYGSNSAASGVWKDGFISGGQFSYSGGTGGIEDGYKIVSSTGAYSAAKTGTTKDGWNAVIATYTIAP